MSVRRAHRLLQGLVDAPVLAVGRFRPWDPTAFDPVMTMMLGAAALGGLSPVTGDAVQKVFDFLTVPSATSPRLPHHILLVVTEDAVTAFRAGRFDRAGPQAAQWKAGAFGAHVARLPFEVDLTIAVERGNRFVFRGKRGWRSGAGTTAKAVVEVADPARCW